MSVSQLSNSHLCCKPGQTKLLWKVTLPIDISAVWTDSMGEDTNFQTGSHKTILTVVSQLLGRSLLGAYVLAHKQEYKFATRK